MDSNPRQRTCFSFIMPKKSFNKPFEFLLYKKDYIFQYVCTVTVREVVTTCKQQLSRCDII